MDSVEKVEPAGKAPVAKAAVEYFRRYKRWMLASMLFVFIAFGILVLLAVILPVKSPFVYSHF